MVSTSPAPTLWSVSTVRSELTRTAPVSISFCARVRDLTAREKNRKLSSRSCGQVPHVPANAIRLAVASAASAANGAIGIEGDVALLARPVCPGRRLVELGRLSPASLVSGGLLVAAALAFKFAAWALQWLRPWSGSCTLALRPACRACGRWLTRAVMRGRLAGRLRPLGRAGGASRGAGCRGAPPGNQTSSNSGSAGLRSGRRFAPRRFPAASSRLDGRLRDRHRLRPRGRASIGSATASAGLLRDASRLLAGIFGQHRLRSAGASAARPRRHGRHRRRAPSACAARDSPARSGSRRSLRPAVPSSEVISTVTRKPLPSAAPAGSFALMAAGIERDQRADDVGEALEDIDAHGALAGDLEARDLVELGDRLRDRPGTRCCRTARCAAVR